MGGQVNGSLNLWNQSLASRKLNACQLHKRHIARHSLSVARASDVCDFIDAVTTCGGWVTARGSGEGNRRQSSPLGESGSVHLGGHQKVWHEFLGMRYLQAISTPTPDPDMFPWAELEQHLLRVGEGEINITVALMLAWLDNRISALWSGKLGRRRVNNGQNCLVLRNGVLPRVVSHRRLLPLMHTALNLI